MLKSTDEGITWFALQSGVVNNLKTVNFVDNNTGYAAGENRTLLKTTDGGIHWAELPVTINSNMNIQGIAIVNSTTIICVGDSIIIRSSNNGASWQTVENVSYYSLHAVGFFDSDTGIAVGNDAYVLRTTDAGMTWNATYLYDGIYRWNFFCVFIMSSQTAYIGADQATLFISNNSGQSWYSGGAAGTDPVNGIGFSNNLIGVAVTPGGSSASIGITTDGGQNWSRPDIVYRYNSRSVFAIDNAYSVAVGDNGSLVRTSDGGNHWTRQAPIKPLAYRSVYFSDPNFGLVVGDSGTILRSNDTGITWHPQQSNIKNQLNCVFLINDNLAFAVGDSGTIIETTSGGTSWKQQQSGVTANLREIFFSNSRSGYAVGDSGTIVTTSDGGVTWVKANSPSTNDLLALRFVNDSTGAIVGRHGTFLWTTDSGMTWKTINIDRSNDLTSLTFGSQDTCFVTGSNGIILRVINGGDNISLIQDGSIVNDYGVYSSHIRSSYSLINFYTIAYTKLDTLFIAGDSGIILRAATGGTYIKWVSQNSPLSSDDYNYVHYTDKENQVVIGNNDEVVKTTDGGARWISQTGSSYEIDAFQFIDNDTWMLIHNMDSLYRSSDAGKHWYLQYSIQSAKIYDIDFINSDTGFVPVDGGLNYTTDGGITWEKRSGNWGIYKTFFTDSITGTGITYQNKVIYTTDGGITWSQVRDGSDPTLHNIDFVNHDIGFIVGDAGTILQTTDGGKSWSLDTEKISSNNFLNITFVESQFGYIVGGNGTILRTTDLGRRWGLQFSKTSQNLYGICFLNKDTGTAVGANGTIIQTNDGGNTWVTQIQCTNNYLQSVYCIDSINAVIVGENGTILHTSNGGSLWSNENGHMTALLNKVFFVGRDTGMAVGLNGVIITTTDGGMEWSNHNYGGTNYNSVFMLDANTAIVVGDSGTIIKTTDNGKSWSNFDVPTSNALYGISFADNNTGVVVGENETIFHTTDAGITWINESLNTNYYIASVAFSNSTTGTAFSDGRKQIGSGHGAYWQDAYDILRTTDGGITWSRQTTGNDGHVFDQSYIDSLHGWAAEIGSVLTTTDGGKSWNSLGGGADLHGIYMTGHTGYAVGGDGLIIRLSYDGGIKSRQYLSYKSQDISFGDVFIGDQRTDSISALNDGGDTIIIDLSQYSNPLFSITPTSITLAPGESGGFGITFSPLDTSVQNGMFVFNYIKQYFNDTVFVTGNGVGPAFETNTRELDYGVVRQGSSLTKYITVSNPGDTTLVVSQINSTNPRFIDSLQNFTINSGQSLSVPITFQPDVFVPDSVVPYSGYIIFVSDAFSSPDSIKVTGGGLSGVKENADIVPGSYGLEQNYPNPFDPVTKISFSIARESQVKLCVYNVLGEMVATLADEKMAAGSYTANFDASALPNGVYFYKLTAGEFSATRSMVLAR
ncbi:MAG TPA: YCF48-related protein [Candidatus Kapabacteria bacterium]|nr:YCF48-related protein [Candidatus Kapabacteria bacterium]